MSWSQEHGHAAAAPWGGKWQACESFHGVYCCVSLLTRYVKECAVACERWSPQSWSLRHARLMQLAPKNVRWQDSMPSHHLTIIHCHNLTGVSLSVEIHPRLACRVAQRNLTLMHTSDCVVKERIGSGKRSTCCSHRKH